MLAYLRAKAMSRGFLGGSQVWMAIGVVVWTIRFFQWLTRPETAVIYRDRLGPGQSVVITHHEPGPTKRQRRRQAADDKAAARAAAKAARSTKRADRKTAERAAERAGKQSGRGGEAAA